MALEFLSVFIRFAKIFSFIKESKSSYFFEWQKSKQKTISFFVKKRNKKTTPFRIRNSLVKTFLQYSESPSLRGFAKNRSNLNLIKFDFYNLISLINKFYTKWIATPINRLAMTIKNKFEIISQLDYGFCYKNYFFNLNQVFRNSYDFGERFGRNLNYGFEKNYNFGFGKNYFGNCNFGFDFGNEICSIGNNLAGFLFNRKIKK